MTAGRLCLWALVGAVLVACAAPSGPTTPSAGEPSTPRAPKRLVIAIAGDIPDVAPSAAIPGSDGFYELINPGLSTIDDQRASRPLLAERVPSIENGLWRVAPDGQMDTTWKIRAGAVWHDGQPLSSYDLSFTITFVQDRDLASFGHIAFDAIETVETPDPVTVKVKWKRPYIEADTLFSRTLAPPLPAHVLAKPYAEDKSSLLALPYWSEEFVGTGPFKVREWVRGSHVVLGANQQYVPGQPKIDSIEFKFIPDTTTLSANILSGTVDLTVGRALDLEEALQVRDQWRDGKMEVGFKSWIALFPQFVNPSPAVIADLRFRRALLHAIDRQQLADVIQAGLVPAAHSYINPAEPEYKEIEGSIVRYEYDPRLTQQLMETLGHSRGPDGVFRDAAGQRLAVELRTIGVTAQKAIFAVADFWQRVGVPTEPVQIPAARTRDNEYRATFPGFQIFQNPNDVNALIRFHSSRAALAANGFRILDNHSRYLNPEFDSLIERYFRTIPPQDRIGLLGQIASHISEQLNVMGLYYGVEPTMIHNRLRNVSARKAQTSIQSWNAYLWDIAN